MMSGPRRIVPRNCGGGSRLARVWIALCACVGAASPCWTSAGQDSRPTTSRPQVSPAVTQPAADPQRMSELLELIQGQNVLTVRRTGARELLRHGWAETPERLTAVLSGSDAAARIAVAGALADLPRHFEHIYIKPLVELLGDGDASARSAAGQALAAGRNAEVVGALRAVVHDAKGSLTQRIAAIDALGLMTDRNAIGCLRDTLDDSSAEIRRRGLTAFENALGASFQGDTALAIQWWDEHRNMPLPQWQQSRIEGLAVRMRSLRQKLGQTTGRLVKAYRDAYLRASEAERGKLLLVYLGDLERDVRLLALELATTRMADRKPLAEGVDDGVRALLRDKSSPRVRAEAVKIVAGFRNADDARTFLQLLDSERDPAVRVALLSGLGYIGDASVLTPLLEALKTEAESAAVSAASSIGRLAERGIIDEVRRAAVADHLLERYQAAATPTGSAALRERILWAMSRVGDKRFGAVFADALGTEEPPAVRRAAATGIEVLGDATLAGALLAASADPDVGLRRAAVAGLAKLGSTELHLDALWARLGESQEPNGQVRDVAWRGVVRILSARPPSEAEARASRLVEGVADGERKAIELLQLAEKAFSGNPEARGDLGRVRGRIASHLAAAGRTSEGVAAYLQAIGDLHVAGSSAVSQVAIELLRLTLPRGLYDQSIAYAIRGTNPGVDATAVWNALQEDIEQLIKSGKFDEAAAMLQLLQSQPPIIVSEAIAGQIKRQLDAALAGQAARAARAALDALRKKPDAPSALADLKRLGARAAPTILAALREAVSIEPPNASLEKQLSDLLTTVLPAWPGFAAEASREEKLKAIDAAAP